MVEVNWGGYIFQVFSPDADWHEVPGLYVFAKQSIPHWTALYIGQAQSFRTRLPTHERWPEAALLGATHIHATVEWDQTQRDLIEQRLVATYQPPMNQHLR